MSADDQEQPEFRRSLRSLTLAGTVAAALFAGTVGVWAVATTLAGAVVASGQFVVDGNVKKVQHATGGIVGELKVREGDRVEQDAVLIRLDDTVTRANLQVLVEQLDEFSARRARLQAERDRHDAVTVAPELASRMSEPEIAELVAAEEPVRGAPCRARRPEGAARQARQPAPGRDRGAQGAAERARSPVGADPGGARRGS